MAKVTTTYSGTAYTHRELWRCCRVQLKSAKRRKRGRMSFDMSAMLMAYLTFEAYLNAVGADIAPETWKTEREKFSKGEYRGTLGKLKFLCELCNVPKIDKGKRPYTSVRHLQTLRHFLAHGKTDVFSGSQTHSADVEFPMWGHNRLRKLVSEELAQRCIKDMEAFIEGLHIHFKPRIQDVGLKPEALKGSLGMTSWHTKA